MAELSWTEIFYDIFIQPIQTFKTLSNPSLHSPALSNILAACLIVLISSIIESCSGVPFTSTGDFFAIVLSSTLADLFFWIVLSLFLRLLASLTKVETSYRTCLIVTGWAFLPLVLKPIAACFTSITILGAVFSWLISLWFLLLEFFAFESILKLGRLKTIGILFLLPPCLFFTYFLSILFASAFLLEGIF